MRYGVPGFLFLAAALATFPASAQAGWSVRPDGSGQATEVKVVAAQPGWKLTSGPASILYRATDRGAGNYRVTAKIALQPGTGAHQEAYGVFLGGTDLAKAGQSYTYFIIRGDGTWKVKRRRGPDTGSITRGWTANPAIVRDRPDGPAVNEIAVVMGARNVRFLVNGQELWSGVRSEVGGDGIAGIRLNHNLSIQLESFAVTPGKP
jgi:hypothetical protein